MKNGLSHLHTKVTAIETAVSTNSVASVVERAVDDAIRPAATESVRSKYNGRVLVRPAAASLTRNDMMDSCSTISHCLWAMHRQSHQQQPIVRPDNNIPVHGQWWGRA